MSFYLSVGDELLSQDEILEKTITGDLKRIKASSKKVSLYGLPGGEKTKFTPVGLGKPLSIEIREIFTGELPKPAWHGFDDLKDLIITTSHKAITQTAAATRAVNLVRDEVGQNHYIKNVAAIEVGTPIIFYSPAMIENSISLTVEFGFEDFPKKTLNILSNAFQSAATIPIFVTKSMWLLAGSIITKLVADIGKAIFEKGPEFIGTDTINFGRAGEEHTLAGFGVLFSADAPPELNRKYTVSNDGMLVNKQNQERYNEKYPYAVVSIDGAPNTSYEKFQHSAASAELLAKFYNIGENSTQPMEELLKGIQYYNDMKFRQEAIILNKEIENFKGDDEELDKLKEKYKAVISNILTEGLKP